MRGTRPRNALAWLLLIGLLLAPGALAHPNTAPSGGLGQGLVWGARGITGLIDPPPAAGTTGEPTRGLTRIGFLPLPGFNADVWVHRGYAYVGSWGTDENYPTQCPATGVRVIDLADPRAPRLVGAVATIPGTSQEDMVAARVTTAAFQGDLLVTGIQACARGSSAPRGLDLWDVSDPRAPQHLAFWASGPFGSSGARGVHELALFQRGDRAYVVAAVPDSERIEGPGDVRLVDVTDPRQPVQVSAWGLGAIGLTPRCDSAACDFAHSAWVNATGTIAVISYWDAGAILLDITDPAKPAFIGRTPYPPGAEGNTHSAWLLRGDSVLLTTDEDFNPANGSWGFVRLWDVRDPTTPREIGRFATPASLATTPPGPGDYSVHNPFVRGNTAYLSWYADGVRVVDLADPTAPREIAAFVPPATPDPFGKYPAAPNVWGVFADRQFVLASDINAGLYVLESAPQCFPETGKCVRGGFLDQWRATGGLAINGYPLSDEFTETLDGRDYTVQYFERARFEYHPENALPYQVLLGQFGRRILQERAGQSVTPPVPPLPGAVYFPQTGHNLGGGFRDYWNAHGGLAQFGYPISEEFTETLEDGKSYTVQYFERARFEYHPENAPPYDIELGQFGRRILAGR